MKRFLLFIFIVVLSLYALDQFFTKNIQNEKKVNPHFTIDYKPEEVCVAKKLFEKPLFYLGKGKQFEVYSQKDVVVKFFLEKKLLAKDSKKVFPFSFFAKQKKQGRITRKERLYKSCQIAYEELSSETGVIFLHLNPTRVFFQKALLVTSAENPYFFDPDQKPFIIQKKAKHLKPLIIESMFYKNTDDAKRYITYAFDLLYQSAKKGVVDTDQKLIKNNNIGILEDRAIYIDFGKLQKMADMTKKRHFEKDLKRLQPLRKWLLKFYPELVEHFDKAEREVVKRF